MDFVKSPQPISGLTQPVVFLAGSIEQGKAKNWYTEVVESLDNQKGTLISPRRDQWDASWDQSVDFEPFNQQVNWELDGIIDCSDVLFFFFQGDTLSPISLLELGISLALNKPTVVVCEPDFWRKGNVLITCSRFNTKVYEDMEQGIKALKEKLEN